MLEIGVATWVVTIAVVLALLAVDFVVAAVRPHQIGFREAALWSIAYVLVALAFGAWMWSAHGSEFGTEYFAG